MALNEKEKTTIKDLQTQEQTCIMDRMLKILC